MSRALAALMIAFSSFALAPPAAAEEVSCDDLNVCVDPVGFVDPVVDALAACARGETDLCDRSVVTECVGGDAPVCAFPRDFLVSCLQGGNGACETVDNCLDSEEGLCAQLLREASCRPGGGGTDVCSDALFIVTDCADPEGFVCGGIHATLRSCTGDTQASPEGICGTAFACLRDEDGSACEAVQACARGREECLLPVTPQEVLEELPDVQDVLCAVDTLLSRPC